jgi:hypothetical protein
VDIVAGLLDGTLHHLHRDQIMTHLLTHRSGNDDPHTDPGDDQAAHDGVTHNGVTRSGVTEDGPTYDAATERADAAGSGVIGDQVARPPGNGGDTGTAGDDQRVGVEVRVAASTLLGHDEQPGEIPGLGPVPACHARALVARQRHAHWRYTITDPAGRLEFDGLTRRRPTGLATRGPRGGIVELHLPAALLTELTSGDAGPVVARWTGVLADITRQYDERDRRDLDAHPDDRLPRAALRRHTQIRDRTCVGIGCRHRPARCDQDHTLDHHNGGPTVAADLGPTVPPRPHPQDTRRLDPPPADPRHLPLDQPARRPLLDQPAQRPLRDPARAHPAPATQPVHQTGRPLARRPGAAQPAEAHLVGTRPTTLIPARRTRTRRARHAAALLIPPRSVGVNGQLVLAIKYPSVSGHPFAYPVREVPPRVQDGAGRPERVRRRRYRRGPGRTEAR